MKSLNKLKILDFIRTSGAVRPADLAKTLGISPQALHRHLRSLVESKELTKKGVPPLVFYDLHSARPAVSLNKLTKEELDYLEGNFSNLLPNGILLSGVRAFESWLHSIKQAKAYQSLAKAYIKQHGNIQKSRNKQGHFDLTDKLRNTFDELCVDAVLCEDFYSLPRFGKTYLGNLVTAGKSGQNKKSITTIAEIITAKLQQLLKDKKIDAIAWVPHSIPRKLLFLPELRSLLGVQKKQIEVVKAYSGEIPVAQKALSKLEDRVANARDTIFIKSTDVRAEHVLIIDDAMGSGATSNELACKIKKKFHPQSIIVYVVVGSFKGFDVINVV